MAKESEILFEIFNAAGDRVEWTDDKSCVLKKEIFQQRLKDGYSFKLNGKVVKTYDKVQEGLQ